MGMFDSVRDRLGGSDDTADDEASVWASDADPAAGKSPDELTPADLRELAEEAVTEWPDLDLNYSLDSLARLDEFAAEQSALLADLDEADARRHRERALGGYALVFGSYFGDVLRREFDGEWTFDGDDWLVTFPESAAVVSVAAHDVATESFSDEPVFRSTATRVETELAGGDGDPSLREQVRAAAARFVDDWPGYDLDYTPASLVRLDDLVAEGWDPERFRDVDAGSEEAARLERLDRQLGSYFGAVLVRHLDAEWTNHDEMGTVVQVTGPSGAVFTANVFHVAEDCLADRATFALTYDTVVAELDLDEQRLTPGEATRPVESDDGR